MAFIWVTDAASGNKVAINPAFITAVFDAAEGAPEGAVAIIGLTNGGAAVKETVDEVIALTAGA